jgi:hypothetical protein
VPGAASLEDALIAFAEATQSEAAARNNDTVAQAAAETARKRAEDAAKPPDPAASEQDKQKAEAAKQDAVASHKLAVEAEKVTESVLSAAAAETQKAASARAAVEEQLAKTGVVVVTTGRWAELDRLIGTSIDTRLLLLVMVSGAIGTSIYAATAFSLHVARLDFGASWLWWYALRFPVGIGLAVLVYFVIRGGLFAGTFANQEAVASTANPFGFAALGALSGMFAEQASDKLKEIFEGIFRTAEKTGFKAAKPVVDPLPPILKGASAGALTLTIRGKGFDKDATVTVNGKARSAKIAADTKTLTVTLDQADVANAGELKLQVVNPSDKGGPSAEAVLMVVEPPSIDSVSSIKSGTEKPTVTVKGRSFAKEAEVFVGKDKVDFEFASPSELSVSLHPEHVAQPAVLKLKVVNPPEAGGASALADLTVTAAD